MARAVELKVKELLAAKGITQAELAKRLGVSKATAAAYYDNSWTVLDRRALEQMIDVFQCDVGSVLVAGDSPFFLPYRDHPACMYVRRPDAKTVETGRPLAYRDMEAAKHIDNLLKDWVDGMTATEGSAITREEFERHAQNNCVVLGSPIVNAAAEIAICRAFGIDPVPSEPSDRLPFHFRVIPKNVPVSSLVRLSPDGKRGIWLPEEKAFLEAETWPREEFRQMDIKKGRDCAVLVVMNHKSADNGVRKLVILSGSGGVGTEGAARALADYFRDLEPREGERVVWGAIEVFYKKSANTMRREITGYHWRYRRGGRCPIAFTLRKP